MRISFDALRLCLLVAAGVTSGYLWRAAFESSAPAEQRITATPPIIAPTPAPRTVHIVPHHLTKTKPAVIKHVVERPVVRAQRSPAALIASPAPSTTPTPTPPTSAPAPTPTPTPTPTTPKPTPAPAPGPTPALPTATPTQAPVAAPVQQAAAPQAAVLPPTTPTTPAASPPPPPPTTSHDDDSRPGWGKGDSNHDHSGPGGDHDDRDDHDGHDGGHGKNK